MKKLTAFAIILLMAVTLLGQAPASFKYQAVLRDARGNIKANISSNIVIDILQGSATGITVYSETHLVTTDDYGLINLEIGNGNVTKGTSLSAINWGTGTFFVKTSVDGVAMGTDQLLSVPYALHAKTAENITGGIAEVDPLFIASPANGITTSNIANWSAASDWGNHAGLYRPINYVPAWSEITSNPFAFKSLLNDQLLKYNTKTSKWENWTPNFLTGFTETDPLFVSWDKSTGITISASQVRDFQTWITNNPAMSANTAKNSYPDADATKLAGIAAGADVNVNADWNAASGDAQILNKPIFTGINTGDQDITSMTHVNRGALDALSGVNTGDQDITSMTHANRVALDAVTGVNTGDQTLPTLASLGAMAANTAITAGTNTKITYDAKGLVTAGSAATTADIAAAADKKYVTDAQQIVIGNISGTNTGDQDISAMTHTNRVALDAVTGVNTGDQTLPTLSSLGAMAGNTAITAGTNTKITYDAKGLVTVGTAATTADIAASTNKNYVTDAQQTVIGSISGVNTGDQTLPTLSSLGAIAANTAITAGTNTKITYDAKGLVTAGSAATTADIAASADKKYVTDAQLIVIGNISGTNTGDQDISAMTHANRVALDAVSGVNTGDQTLPTLSSLDAIAANTAITAGTNTKITYDAKGLVTAGAVATTADIAASTNKNYVTDAQQTVIGSISGVNTGDQTLPTLSSLGAIAANTAITAGTNTKITYDAKGLVTAGTAATTADIAASTNRNYVTDSQQTLIGSTSGTNTGDQDITSMTHANRVALDAVTGVNTGDQTLPTLSSLGAIAANSAITAGTNTKITYDAKGLVTAGAVATTADIAASTNKNYVTDAQQTVIGSISGVNTGDQTLPTLSSLGAVAGNSAITAGTNTKITYDAKGLVTAGSAATTADIAASADKKYVTDAQLIVIENASGTNTGDNATNTQYSGLVTNATHTGEVTGSTALTIANNAVTDAKFRQGAALSIVGVTGNATANTADIQGTTDQILRIDGAGTTLAFGSIDLSKSATIGTSVLPVANGGMGADVTPAEAGEILYSSSTTAYGHLATGTSGQVLTSAGPDATPTWEPAGTGSGWALTGNVSTVDGTNFIGTTDDVPFNVRVNGEKAGRIDNQTGSTYNTFWGYQAGNSTTGISNTAIGFQALLDNVDGADNTAIGVSALNSNTSGSSNTAIGEAALSSNVDGSNNTALGYGADVGSGSLTNATAIGYGAIVETDNSLVLGSGANVGIGISSPLEKLDVDGNIQFSGALMPNNTAGTPGQVLTSAGDGTVPTWTTISSGGIGGSGTLNYLPKFTPDGTTLDKSLIFDDGAYIGIGTSSPSQNLDVVGNIKFSGALMPNNTAGTSGQVLTSDGDGTYPIWTTLSASSGWALTGNAGTDGSNFVGTTDDQPFNVKVNGQKAGSINRPLGGTFWGYQAGNSNTGSNNTAIGYSALLSNTTGSNNTAFGYGADVSSGSLTNATAIGYNAKVAASSSLVLGGTGADAVNVGIGTTTPSQIFDVVGNIQFTGALMPGGNPGTAGYVLVSAGGFDPPTWNEISPGGIGGSGTLNYIPKFTPNGTTLGNSLIFDDGTNVGIGTATPEFKLSIDNDGGIIAKGEMNSGPSLTTAGAGTRMIWYPKKAAFRAGYVNGSQWDLANVGSYSTAMGFSTTASGSTSTAMGYSTIADGQYSTATGFQTTASGQSSTAMGASTIATGDNSTSIGYANTASGNYSTAMGRDTEAIGEYSIAMGRGVKASATYSTVVGGWRNTASGENSTAMGYWTNANAQYSTALGASTTASGISSTAMGQSTTASGISSTAMGASTTASEQYSTAMGQSTTASGISSTAMGRSTIASGNYSTAMGYQTTANQENSTAMGQSTIASGANSTAMGAVTTASGLMSTAMGAYTTASGNYSTAMGNQTTASGDNSTAMGYYASTNALAGAFIISDNSTSTTTNSSIANEMTMRFNGGYRLFSNTALTAGVTLASGASDWAIVSDRRKKENFITLNPEDFLLKIKNMPVTEWNYKSQNKSIHHIGPMAQDFYAAFQLSGLGNDTTITTSDINGVNMIAIQALEKRTDQLKRAQDELRLKTIELEKLKAEVDNLKQYDSKIKLLEKENAEFKDKFIKLENVLVEIQLHYISTKSKN